MLGFPQISYKGVAQPSAHRLCTRARVVVNSRARIPPLGRAAAPEPAPRRAALGAAALEILQRTPCASPSACDSAIMRRITWRVPGSPAIASGVPWVSALTGLKVRLPHRLAASLGFRE